MGARDPKNNEQKTTMQSHNAVDCRSETAEINMLSYAVIAA